MRWKQKQSFHSVPKLIQRIEGKASPSYILGADALDGVTFAGLSGDFTSEKYRECYLYIIISRSINLTWAIIIVL